MNKEVERIVRVYEERDRRGKRALYTSGNPANLLAVEQRERAMARMLPPDLLWRLATVSILDVGCGNGGTLRDMVRLGADPARCHGVDLLSFRITEARALSPTMTFSCGNGEQLSYDDGTFGLTICFTVFSSILSEDMRWGLAREMLRVAQPRGVVLLYDFLIADPRNRDVRGLRRREIGTLFPACDLTFRRITLLPPLARLLAPVSPLACRFLQRLPPLCSHYLVVIRKR